MSNGDYRPAQYLEPQVQNHDMQSLGSLIPGVLERGRRQESVIEESSKNSDLPVQKSRRKLFPTNSERMNRALKELGKSAFKVHTLLWKWRGAPARGKLPFFTIHSLSTFCSLTRPTVRSAVRELVRKGWIQKLGYSVHKKNELYKLIPIRDVPGVVAVK